MTKIRILLYCAILVAFVPLDAASQTIVVAGGSGGGSGSVTSVDATAVAPLTVTGGPFSTTGTLVFDWTSCTAHYVLAAPSGASGKPTCRLLVAGDIPSIAPSQVTGTAVITTDSRLTDSRTPTAHASTHAAAGSDPVTVTEAQVTNLATDLSAKESTTAHNSDVSTLNTAISGKVATSTTVCGHALTTSVACTASDVGLSAVTNDAQTKASVVPNTAPAAGQIAVGNAGGTAYAPQAVSGDCTMASTGAITCTKVNGNTPGNAAVSHQFVTTIDTSARGTTAQPAFTDIFGTASSAQIPNNAADTTGKSAKADALNSATTVVNVAAATAPTNGQVLTATSGTAATWQTPSSSSAPFADNTALVKNNADNTKTVTISASGLTTGNNATLSVSGTSATPIWSFPGRVQVGDGASGALALGWASQATGWYLFSTGPLFVKSGTLISLQTTDGHTVAANKTYAWSAQNNDPSGTADTALGRIAAGVVGAGTSSSSTNSSGTMRALYFESGVGGNVASASTITPTGGMFHLTGTATLSTINLPRTGYTGCLRIISDGAATVTTGGNIATAATFNVGKVNEICYDGTSWYPGF